MAERACEGTAIYVIGLVISGTSCNGDSDTRSRFPFLVPKRFRTGKVVAKFQILSLKSWPFYSHSIDINRGFLRTKRFRGIHLTVFRYKSTKCIFTVPRGFLGFQKTVRRNGLVNSREELDRNYLANI